MPEIRFQFNLEKLVHALAFFSERRVSDLTKLKAAKLFYFADKEHLLKYGRPILGDVYFCLPYGPIPSLALNEMTDAIARPEVPDADVCAFKPVVSVHKPLFGGYPVFRSRGQFDREVFSESELDVLEHVVQRYGRFTSGQLVNLTHREPTWTIPNEGRSPEGRSPIPYELFFVGASAEAQQVLEVLQAEQQERREMDSIMRSARRAGARDDQVFA